MSDAESAAAPKTTVTVTVDGASFEANPGELLIAAAEKHGTYIPRFCWHPRMKEVGMCRMCLVEVDGPRGKALQPACMLPVAEGMSIDTKSPTVKKAQDGVLEFLLVNHPLDCPVCDKGGECPLQDQTLTFGPGESRFVEEKRHYEKPIAISELVYLDRERCILCDRCTRFSKDVAGDPLIHFVNRGNATEVNTFPDDPFSSYFSGNTVQICPVGALTAKPYRFSSRPWDLDQVESTCTTCSVGCRVVVQSSGDRITRYQGVDSDPVNWGWLCDKGRFGFESVHAEGRLTHPQSRADVGSALETVSWSAALKEIAGAVRATSPSRVGVLGGARLTNEDAYAWVELAKGVIGTDHVDAQLGDGLAPEMVFGVANVTIDDACTATAVILLAPDLKEELPVLHLRLRDAAVNRRVPIIELSQTRSGLSSLCAASVQYRPGEAHVAVKTLLSAVTAGGGVERTTAGAEADEYNAAGKVLANAIEKAKGNARIVVVVGRSSVAEGEDSLADAVHTLRSWTGGSVSFLPVLRRANVRGALELGMSPGLLPGRTDLDTGRAWWTAQGWTVPAERGHGAAAMLRACAAGELDVLFLLGADPIADFPDARLAAAALAKVPLVVSVDTLANESNVAYARVVLPAAGYGEKDGTTTNLEGRVTALTAKVSAPGLARPDWMIAVELAALLGADLEVESVQDLTAEMSRTVPTFAGVDRAAHVVRPDGLLLGVASSAPAESTAEAATETEASTTEASTAAAVSAEDTDDSDAGSGSGSDEVAPAAVSAPSRLTWAGAPEAGTPTPDSYSLRLVASRTLYDQGTLVQAAPSLAPLALQGAAHLHPGEIERHGLHSGDSVLVTSQTASVRMHVTENEQVPRGVVWIPIRHGANGAEALIDLNDIADSGGITKVRIETVGS